MPITLSKGSEQIALLAVIDTGASDCFFEYAQGELLGLEIECGERSFLRPQPEGWRHSDTSFSSTHWEFSSNLPSISLRMLEFGRIYQGAPAG